MLTYYFNHSPDFIVGNRFQTVEIEMQKDQIKPNCAECRYLGDGAWCQALEHNVSGSRHIRRCEEFIFDKPNPKPVRKGHEQSSGLVQCVKCQYFIPWGDCEYGHSELHRLEPRIWRRCSDYNESEFNGCCNDCIHEVKSYCTLAEHPVTGKYDPIACQYFIQIKA